MFETDNRQRVGDTGHTLETVSANRDRYSGVHRVKSNQCA